MLPQPSMSLCCLANSIWLSWLGAVVRAYSPLQALLHHIDSAYFKAHSNDSNDAVFLVQAVLRPRDMSGSLGFGTGLGRHFPVPAWGRGLKGKLPEPFVSPA